MDIVLEGPDNAGKSTLALRIAEVTGRQVIPSEGREKYPGEINTRIRNYLENHKDVIFDRHPVISQDMYFRVVKNTPPDVELTRTFYARKPLIIYCRASIERGMQGHVAKEYDDPEYLKRIEANFRQLCMAYNNWALDYAHMLYRIGDDLERFLQQVKGAIQ